MTPSPRLLMLRLPTCPRDRLMVLMLSVLAILVYVAALVRHTENWPFADDYPATLGFLVDWQEASSWRERLTLLFRPHNEHRLVFNHLIELADLKAFGQIHFGHMVAIGNLCWALALITLMRAGRKAHLSWLEMTPAILLACALSHHDLMIWAMASLQQYGQILFCLLAVWAASQGHFGWSLLAASAAAGAGGGGFAVFPALALCWATRGHWLKAALTLLLMGVWLFLHTTQMPLGSQGTGRLLTLLTHPIEALGYTLCFMGSVGKSTQVSILLGALLLLCLAWLMLREDAMQRQPFFTMVGVWLVTCAVLAALARLHLGVDQARSTRYTPHAITLLTAMGMLGVSLAQTAEQRRTRWRCWAALGVILWLTWLAHGWTQQSRQHEAMVARQHIAPPSQEDAQRVLEAARARMLFDAPSP